MNSQTRRRHFSMIRSFHLADLFTIANGFCGVGAIFEAMKYLSTNETRHIYLAALLVPLMSLFAVATFGAWSTYVMALVV